MRAIARLLADVCLLLLPGVLHAQEISGELRQWHDVVLTFVGPETSELADPNPFLFHRLDVTFTKGDRSYVVAGYFAADGNAAETSATSGNRWRVHFVPDATGEWAYRVSFRSGPGVAVAANPEAGRPVNPDASGASCRTERSSPSRAAERAAWGSRRINQRRTGPSSSAARLLPRR